MSGEDKRKFVRATLNLLVNYESTDEFCTDYTQDISGGGLFIRTNRPLPVGTKLRIHFMLPGVDELIYTDGVVVRNTLNENSPVEEGMGIEFTEILPRYQAIIDKLVKEGLKKH
ncbi:MAG: hypothetical protein Kow0090_17310 [Myxococcota bacterium]